MGRGLLRAWLGVGLGVVLAGGCGDRGDRGGAGAGGEPADVSAETRAAGGTGLPETGEAGSLGVGEADSAEADAAVLPASDLDIVVPALITE